MIVLLLVATLLVGGLVVIAGLTARKVEAMVPPVGRFITVDGVRLHYLDVGTGPIVLMIHGLASQLQTFTHSLTARLEDRYRLIVVDRPGSGYSQAPRAASLGAQADLIGRFLTALNIDRALVVGHSLGGAVALAIAVDQPHQVSGVALLAPATRPQDDVPDALRHLAIRSDLLRWITAWTVAIPLALRLRNRVLRNLFSPDRAPPDFGTRAGGLLGMRPANFRNASRDLVEVGGELATYAARHHLITVPVGILFGAGDRILDYRHHGRALKDAIPDVIFELIEDGGHMTPISSPEIAAAFIDRIAERAGLLERAVSA